MNFAEAVAFLNRHINLEVNLRGYEGLSLDKMRLLCAVLGDPQSTYPIVHVTGTNGKGSTSLMVTSLLHTRGLNVGTFTSPHVESITERIRINGQPLSERDFAAVVSDLAQFTGLLGEMAGANRSGQMAGANPPAASEQVPSHFELLTAAAFQAFADRVVDAAVVEVGVLGRFDATNVADATIAVITNVGKDHTDGQGDWRERIAREKAGIIKPGSVLVLGETDADLRPIFLDEGAAKVVERGRDFSCVENRLAMGGRLIDVRTPRHIYRDIFLPLRGAHMGDNAALALAAAEEFFDDVIEADVVEEGFAAVKVPGRFEVVHRSPLVILDVAHNPDGARAAAATLRDEFGEGRPRLLVVGLLQGRDPVEMFEALDARRAETVICCTADSPRAYAAADLVAAARTLGIDAEAVPGVADAVERALVLANDDAVILVTGSVYTVGAARTSLVH